MKYLEKIIIKNFMCYEEETVFTFSPGINAIIGRNDGGKSTILAAIQWVVFGKPSGGTVVSWNGDKNTFVKLYFSDGVFVERSRIKETNLYRAASNNEEAKEYRAMGNSIPDEIIKLLQLQDINFQGQANNLFPMQMTPAELGISINKYCQLGQMHETVKRLTSEVTRDQSKKDSIESEMTVLQEKIDASHWVVECEGKVTTAYSLLSSLTSKRQSIEKANALVDEIKTTEKRHDKAYNKAKSLSTLMKEAKKQWQSLIKTEEKRNMAASIMKKIKDGETEKGKNQKILALEKSFGMAKRLFSSFMTTKKEIEKVRLLCKQIENVKKDLIDKKETIRKTKETIQTIRKNLPKTCPLCGSTL